MCVRIYLWFNFFSPLYICTIYGNVKIFTFSSQYLLSIWMRVQLLFFFYCDTMPDPSIWIRYQFVGRFTACMRNFNIKCGNSILNKLISWCVSCIWKAIKFLYSTYMQRVDKIIYRHHKSHKNVFICEMANNIKNEKKVILGKNKNVVRVRRRCAHMFCVGAFFSYIHKWIVRIIDVRFNGSGRMDIWLGQRCASGESNKLLLFWLRVDQ